MMRKETLKKILMSCAPRKEICFKAGDNFGKICNAKPATFFSPEDSNCMDESQSYVKQRKCVLSSLGPNNKSRLSERDFVTMKYRERMNCVALVV